jgi:hypothetical protein
MKIHRRFRQVGIAALAISSAVLFLPSLASAAPQSANAGGPSTQGAANASDANRAAVHADGDAALTEAIAEAVAEVSTTPGDQECDGTTGSAAGNGTVDDDGTYGDSCDFGPSENGNGDGDAVGKPCAGCVGNADDVNPGGQEPGPKNDDNSGYECDPQGAEDGGNAGVGVGNPAHTGCSEPTPPLEGPISTCTPSAANNFCGNPPPPPPPPPPPGPPPVAEENAPVALPTDIAGAELLGRRPAEVLGVQFGKPGVAPAAFARTGAEPGALVTAALMMLFTGALLLAVIRRQGRWVAAK